MFTFDLTEHKYKHIHFIGIGGISMSALAELMHSHNYYVTGSDAKTTSITNHLKDIGIRVFDKHSKTNVDGADLVVYTDAVSMDNPELSAAIFLKTDVIDRASFLGALMKNYKVSIAVSGTHGKTTTTSMIASTIKDHKDNPTILLGGNLGDIHGNLKIGDNTFFLTEACEYRANVLKYFPTTAIVLNIDEDHLDFFDNMDHIIDTFKGYVENLQEKDLLILNIDDPHARTMTNFTRSKLITLSVRQEADYQAKEIHYSPKGFPNYDLYVKGEFAGKVSLKVMGLHNVSNSLAAIASCHENGIPLQEAILGVESYSGVERRLEVKGIVKGITVIDDYAHHPTEILSSLKALESTVENRLICIFQPHTFTRTKLLLENFSKSFHQANLTIITDIYAAREKDYGDIHSKTLVEAIQKQGDKVKYIASHEEVLDFLIKNAKEGDTILTMGAGDVYTIGEKFIEYKKES